MARKHNRKVRFAPEHHLEVVEAVPMEHRSNYWMSKKEFDDIKQDCAEKVAKSRLDKTIYTRGLETRVMTGELFLQCYLHRRGALRAVLKEQGIQKEIGYNDSDDIASAYIVFSRKSIETAQLRAKLDELAVRL
jgi:hypothetical protein